MSGRLVSAIVFCGWTMLAPAENTNGFVALFSSDGVPEGWLVRKWDDIKKPAATNCVWKVENGVLNGSEPRGTWLISEKEYGDFILEFEWKLGEQGNSGAALRAPVFGDPAFDGLELQMVDPRYYPETMKATAAELSGSLYKAVAPTVQAYRPGAWNSYQITCRGPLIKVVLNGQAVLDIDLDQQVQKVQRHDNTEAPPLKDRPRKGHIGFQELSRGGGRVQIRQARIRGLD